MWSILAHVEAVEIEGVEGGHCARSVSVDGIGGAIDALQCPFEYSGVLAEAGPQELAAGAAAEPVDVEDLRQQLAGRCLGADVEPVLEVVADVVAQERQHRHRVAAHDTDLPGGGGGGFRGQRGGEEHAVLPVQGLGDQRDGGGAAAAEEDRRDRHPGRVVPFGGHGRALRDRGAVARVRVRGGLFESGVQSRRFQSVDGRWMLGHAFPPHVAVVGERDVGEDRVAPLDGGHRVGVGVAPVPGATPKNPASGLTAYSRPSSPNRIQAMSSPMVSAVHPGRVG